MSLSSQQREKFLNTEGWAEHWAREESDKPVGDGIIETFRPFMLDLLDQGLSWKTLRRHQGNLRLLGSLTLDLMTQFPETAPATADEALDDLLNGCDLDSCPKLRYASRAEQQEFDTTCRRVFKFRKFHKPVRGSGLG